MSTILVIGDKLFKIEDPVEKKLLDWSQAPRTAMEVSPEVTEQASMHIREIKNIVYPPKRTGSRPVQSHESQSGSKAQKEKEPPFQMADDGDDDSKS